MGESYFQSNWKWLFFAKEKLTLTVLTNSSSIVSNNKITLKCILMISLCAKGDRFIQHRMRCFVVVVFIYYNYIAANFNFSLPVQFSTLGHESLNYY